MSGDWTKIGAKADFPPGRTVQVVVDGREICVANANGDLSAFDDTCTHQQAQLSGCPVEDGDITCPLHGARFDVRSGAVKAFPATEPLTLHELKVDGDAVLIRPNEG